MLPEYVGYFYPLCLLSIKSCLQLGGLPGPELGADIFLLLSGKEILVNPSLRDFIIVALQAFNPRHTHIHSLIHLSIAAQRALSRIVSKCNNQNVIRVIYVKSLQKPMSKYSYFEEKFVKLFHRVSTLITAVSQCLSIVTTPPVSQ